jgi:ribosomal protein S18 acetylase RimI-like enzyme
LKINIASKLDLKTVIDLANKIWPISYKGILSEIQIQNMMDKIYSLENLTYEIEKLGHVFWIANDEIEPVGYISAYVDGDNLWIKKLYILPEKQGKGYGSHLTNTAVNYFKDAKAICLFVNINNKGAQTFYKAKGFEVIDTVPVKMGDHDFTDFIMRKLLYGNKTNNS